jgi:hypothetical protein
MSEFKITGHVDERHMLSAQVPDSVPPGPVTVWIVPAPPDEAEWMAGIAREWSDELSDERQDIYTLDDGEPLDAA